MSVSLKRRRVRDSEEGRFSSVVSYDSVSNVLTIEDGIALYSTRGIETGDLYIDEDERKALNDVFAAIGDFVRVDEYLSSTDKWYTYYLVRTTKVSMDAFRAFVNEEGLVVDGSEHAFSFDVEDRNKVCSFSDKGVRLYRERGVQDFADFVFDLGGMDYERDGVGPEGDFSDLGDSRRKGVSVKGSRIKDSLVEATVVFRRDWFREQMENYNDYFDFFNDVVGLGCDVGYPRNTGWRGNDYTFYITADESAIKKFLDEYDSHIVGKPKVVKVSDSSSKGSRIKDGVGEFNWAESAVYDAVLHELRRGSRSGYANDTVTAGKGTSGDAYTSYTGNIDLSCYFAVGSDGLTIDDVQFYPADSDSEETLDIWVDTYKVAEALADDYPSLAGAPERDYD